MIQNIDSTEFLRRCLNKQSSGRTVFAPIFRLASRVRLTRSWVIRLVCRLEGGQMWSSTYRELMFSYYGVEIGMYSYGSCLRPGCLPAGTRIGNYCSLADGLQVFRRNHPVDRISQHPFFFNPAAGLLVSNTIPSVLESPLTIGHDVWIGHRVIVAPGCKKIGDSAVIASGAIVTADVPAFAIVGGVPARLIRWRLPEELRALWIESKWWLKPVNELATQLDKFVDAFCAERPLFSKDSSLLDTSNTQRLDPE